VTLDCSNDRYTNDEATCIAIAGFLSRTGIKVQPRIMSGAKIAQQINPPGYNTSLTMLSYAPSTYDAHLALASLIATRNPQTGAGAFNIGGYSDPAVDALIGRIQKDTDPDDRRALIKQALAIIKASDAFIPIYQLEILWGVRDGVTVVEPADLSYPLRLFSVK
jgi:peptide/nickel transport system substrate-binding protein